MTEKPTSKNESFFSKLFRAPFRWIRRHRLMLEFVLFLKVLTIIYFWNSILISIKPGEAGVLYMRFFGGTILDKTYSEGIHFLFPWDEMSIYDVRVQHVQSTFNVLTADGLWIEISVSIRFHPLQESLGLLHVHLGPEYVDKIIVPEIQSVLRIIIGQLRPEDIFNTSRNFLDIALQESLLQVSEKYVRIDDLLITNVNLPPLVKNAIERKLERKQIALEYVYRLLESELEAKRKKIEAQGIHDFQEIVSEGISEQLLAWQGIDATLKLAESNNAKIVIIGNNENGLPLIFNADSSSPSSTNIPSATEITDTTRIVDQMNRFMESLNQFQNQNR